MNSKIPFLAIIFSSALLLSACGAQNTVSSSSDQGSNQVQNQAGNTPSGTPDRGSRPTIDYTAAAKKLNVTEKVLKEALGVTDITDTANKPSGTPQKMDLTSAAKKLNVTVEVLQQALGLGNSPQEGTPPQDGNPPPQDDSQSVDNTQ